MSKFGSAFKQARSSGKKTFDFGGKSYNTKLAKGGVGVAGSNKTKAPKSDMNSGPKTGAPMPKSRSSAISSMTKSRPSASGLTDVAFKPSQGGPSKRGGGPKIAMSQANIDKRKASKPKGDNSFSGNISNAAKGVKKFLGY